MSATAEPKVPASTTMTSFPTDPAERKALAARMSEIAPELMADINTLRQLIPTAKVVYFEGGGLEVGRRSEFGSGVSLDEILKSVPAKREAEPAKTSTKKRRAK